MKTKTQHTPTPWKIDPRGVGTPWNFGTDKEDVGITSQVSNDRNNQIRSENVAFIVRAVNEYKSLLKENIELRIQKEKLLEVLATARAVIDAYHVGDHLGTQIIYLEKAVERLNGRKINMGIAQAEGGK